ncbi:GGDEF domain-containing protein [Serpentinicella alkaliphila]|uniref:Diguanylate cyclase (GGDEF)-like protein n=1 Tax=Serpentinicella alkaliphila TaxID=1734049 RepID=A0A4R2TVU3_9FIRM|nr:GGDEF domain-containing protein [Serpentinicella alkaliphila]QUH26809.1 GGDEF domain-containing protein [Serpentinicella alkaliphila]TCQ08031.1 diguanylate cyclase (GGDEF)-like protein [Serpentinicella alkaliphila]
MASELSLIVLAVLFSSIISFIIQNLVFEWDKESGKKFFQCMLIILLMALILKRIPLIARIQLHYGFFTAIVFNIYKQNIFISSVVSFFTSIIINLADIGSGLLLHTTSSLLKEDITSSIELNTFLYLTMLAISVLLISFVNLTCREFYINKNTLNKYETVMPLVFILILFVISSLRIIQNISYANFHIAQLLMLVIIITIMGLLVSFFILTRDYLIKSSEYELMKKRIEIDSMTNTYVRESGLNYMREAIDVCKKDKKPISFGFIDINNLKHINDSYGHLEGDKCIVRVSGAINSILRKSDYICRLGGDEFVFALPGCEYIKAEDVVNRIRLELGKISSELSYDISISVGLYEKNPIEDIELEEIINTIDKEMYKDKINYKILTEKSL